MTQAWAERCRERLLPALDAVREQLERHLAQEPNRGSFELPSEPSGRAALDVVVEAFQLGVFEVQVLLLCAGVELDSRIALLCAKAHGDARARHASFGLALSALSGAHFRATAPVSPLRRWNLVQLEDGAGLADRRLRIAERVLHFLQGSSYMDDALDGLVQPCAAPSTLSVSQVAAAQRLAEMVRCEAERNRQPVLHLSGGQRADQVAVAQTACGRLGLALYVMRSSDVPADPQRREAFARIWERDAILSRSALLLEATSGENPSQRLALDAFLESTGGLFIVAGGDPPELRARGLMAVETEAPSQTEQQLHWSAALPGALSDAELEALVGQFSLPPAAIDDLAAQARAAQPAQLAEYVWAAARRRVRPALGSLAQPIEPRASWELLVLPGAQRATLRDVAVHVRQRRRVYETWGFATRSSRGLGISALFAGPSGTGKTMAAEVLARELKLDLLHVDLSNVISKYIGETEKNLSRIFDAADRGGAILLFDEADALFGRRSEVSDSHDRYANIEVSYLLQRMESYRGLAILTTNLEGSLDPAFMRRIRFVVRFPYPEPEQRAQIWRGIFPSDTPTHGLDAERLGRLNVAGGNIRNIALHAAFLAAEEQSAVSMRHVADAARGELRKLGITPPERELRGWDEP